ncbi:hypothetical protein [Amycolatopsis suaedae]|uniref:Uncharacterized protein n=1 Tax=Amycolatopsis suaedae TaxID=2510978 RepID=A0A4Q7J350_9PSEU|nr:hypothetical protein [Amycolatopsis suaedae]RZQ61911.1 hypothetical protein EWH70_20040 [Amycolatopsis suaedae]
MATVPGWRFMFFAEGLRAALDAEREDVAEVGRGSLRAALRDVRVYVIDLITAFPSVLAAVSRWLYARRSDRAGERLRQVALALAGFVVAAAAGTPALRRGAAFTR